MTDSKQAHEDALTKLKHQEQGKAIGEACARTATTVWAHHRALLECGMDEGLVEELTINFQNTDLAMSFAFRDGPESGS